MAKTGKRGTVDRRDNIVKILKEKGKVKVEELSEIFSVSSVTIRNDLEFLEEKGILHRIYGGALKKETVSHDSALVEKEQIHQEEKRKIGEKAAELIEPGESIILDSGSTTLQIAKNLSNDHELTVMTNAINIAFELTPLSNINLMLTGGTLRKRSYSLVGPEADMALSRYYFDKFFLGLDGIDLDFGVTTPNPLEAKLNRIMVDRAHEVIVVTDSSKFGKKSFSFICEIEEIDRVITDDGIFPEYVNALANMNIKVTIV